MLPGAVGHLPRQELRETAWGAGCIQTHGGKSELRVVSDATSCGLLNLYLGSRAHAFTSGSFIQRRKRGERDRQPTDRSRFFVSPLQYFLAEILQGRALRRERGGGHDGGGVGGWLGRSGVSGGGGGGERRACPSSSRHRLT